MQKRQDGPHVQGLSAIKEAKPESTKIALFFTLPQNFKGGRQNGDRQKRDQKRQQSDKTVCQKLTKAEKSDLSPFVSPLLRHIVNEFSAAAAAILTSPKNGISQISHFGALQGVGGLAVQIDYRQIRCVQLAGYFSTKFLRFPRSAAPNF